MTDVSYDGRAVRKQQEEIKNAYKSAHFVLALKSIAGFVHSEGSHVPVFGSIEKAFTAQSLLLPLSFSRSHTFSSGTSLKVLM